MDSSNTLSSSGSASNVSSESRVRTVTSAPSGSSVSSSTRPPMTLPEVTCMLKLYPSRNEQQLPRRPPPLQVAVRLRRVGKRVFVVNPHLQLARAAHREQIAGALLELFAGGDVVAEGGAGEEEGAFLGKLDRVGRRAPAG